jgi:hypothetical protein
VRRGSSGNLWIRRHRAARAGAPDGSKAIAEVGGGTLLLEGRKQPGSVGLVGNGAAPALGLAPPRRRGTAATVSARPCARGRRGRRGRLCST